MEERGPNTDSMTTVTERSPKHAFSPQYLFAAGWLTSSYITACVSFSLVARKKPSVTKNSYPDNTGEVINRIHLIVMSG